MLESPFVNRTGISVIAEGRHDGKDPIAEHVPSNPVDRKALLTIDPSVIFVHGLGGDPTDSWTHENKKSDQKTHRTIFRKHKSTNASSSSENGPPMGTSVFWPQHLLPEEIPNVRVMTYGYDSDPVKFFGPVNRTNLYSHAMTMLGDVVGCRTTSDTNRPIIWIAHSLGGILVKDALVQSRDAQNKPGQEAIFKSTHAILFFGTPHRGSDWVGIARTFTIFALGKSERKVLNALRVDSEVLQRIADSFAVMLDAHTFEVTSFTESKSMTDIIGLTDKIVKEYSSTIGSSREWRVTLDGNHRTMIKFKDANDAGFKRVLNGLRRGLESIKKTGSIGHYRSHFDHHATEEFIDRAEICELLERVWLQPPGKKSHDRFALYGEPGSGKSVLVKRFASKWIAGEYPTHPVHWETVWILNAKSIQDLEASIISAGGHLVPWDAHEEMSNRVARILDKLREQGSCLIVFDGVVDYAHLDKFFVKAKGNFHIITSRVPAATIPTMNSQGILPMTETEAISLFYMTVTPRTNPPGLMEQGVSDSSVQKLVRRMSCLPGAIHLAGLGISQEHGGLREYSLDTVIQNYCSRLEDDPSEEAKTLGPIFESWKPSMDKLEEGARRGEELFKNALEILYFLTFVNGKGFELRMFETYQKNIREADETDQHRAYGLDTMRTKSDLRELKAAADKLCSLGFIIMNGGSQLGEVHLQYAMSTMIQSVARQSLKDKPFEYHKHKAIATLVDTIPLKEDKDSEEVRRALVPHVESIFQLLGPKDLESLASKITMTLDAESHALQGNLDDPMRTINITDYMLQFSRILSDYGRIQESNDLRQEAVKRLDKAVKDDTVTPVDSRLRSQQLVAKEALASSQMVDGEFHAALEAREFIVECRKAELPNEETELLRAQANLAQSYYCLGHKEKSFTIREIVYQARTATQFGGGVYERVQSMRALATSHFSMGRRPEALELRQEALELGQDLSALIVTDMMSELAESLEDDGQVLAARELLKEVLKRCQSEQSRGSLHHARVALAHSDTLLGDPDKARELLREESLMEPKETYTNRESELQFQAAKIKARLGDVIFAKPALEGLHNATDNLDNKLHIMETLATMETDGGERLRIRREILKQAEESWGIHSRDTLLARYRIGNSHLENGEYLKAESIYKEVCDLQEKHLFSRKAGEKVAHPDVMKTKAKLAETYRRLYYQDEGSCSTASRSENSDPSSLCSPDDLQAVRNASGTSRGAGVTLSASLPALAELENGNGAAFELDFKFSANDNDRWRELSASLRKEVVDQRRFILGEENRHTLDAMEQLIETYANDGKIGMAVDLFTKIVQARRSRIGPFHPKTQLAEEDLRQLSATLPRPLDLANVEPICDESMSRAEEELQRLSVTLESRPTATDAELVSDDLMSGRERRRQGRVAARWKAITWKSLRWP